MFCEPHSTKQIEDAVGWGHDAGAQVLVDTTAARLGCDGTACESIEPLCEQVRCPVTVLHGTADRIRGIEFGERLAELTGGTLIRAEGSGHGPMARDPGFVNHRIREFRRGGGGGGGRYLATDPAALEPGPQPAAPGALP